MVIHRKTPGEASRLLAEYEAANKDIPKEVRMQMAVFVLAPKVGKRALEDLFQRRFATTPFVHLSWLWATAFTYSGIDHLWDEFVYRRNGRESPKHALRWLMEQLTPEQEALLSRRLGGIPEGSGRVATTAIWTRGGVWNRNNNMTRIILLGEHLDRDHSYNAVSRALSPAQAAALERELHNLINPDLYLYHDAQHRAVDYTRRRIPEILAYERPTTSYKTVSWFFQMPVPHPAGGFVEARGESRYPRSYNNGRERLDGGWFPSG